MGREGVEAVGYPSFDEAFAAFWRQFGWIFFGKKAK
jgi:hypothetical protein